MKTIEKLGFAVEAMKKINQAQGTDIFMDVDLDMEADAYDHNAGRYALPSQAAWFVHPKYKEQGRENFEL